MRYNTSMCFSLDASDIALFVIIGIAVIALVLVILFFTLTNVREEQHNKEIREL